MATARKRRVMRLRQLRREREMTQIELGRRVGLDASTICLIERGLRNPSLDVARDLSQVFGVSIEELLDQVEVPA